MTPTITAVVVSWQGMHQRALAIVSALADAVDRVLVIYSNAQDTDETGPGQWTRVPDSDFFGHKFDVALRALDPEEPMLLIQADAGCDDWAGLARRARHALSPEQGIGVWSPHIDNTSYPFALAADRGTADDPLIDVLQTDGIVIALGPAILQRLRDFDFASNNLGWGIDWAAICAAATQGLRVVVDVSVEVTHPQSRGYDSNEANRQMETFLRQLDEGEGREYFRRRNELRLRMAEGTEMKKRARTLFMYSLYYLFVLFVALLADVGLVKWFGVV